MRRPALQGNPHPGPERRNPNPPNRVAQLCCSRDDGSVSEESLLTWCVVANVVGDDGESRGTKHFSKGTKVWVLPPQWGDGGQDVFVAGRHRGEPGGLVRMVLPRRQLREFRVKPVYSPSVMAQLERPWREGHQASLWASKDEAEQVAAMWCSQAEGIR